MRGGMEQLEVGGGGERALGSSFVDSGVWIE